MTTSEYEETAPIFVGGTGRSGTTIMGRYLNTHQSITAPVHENKLIVQDDGLRSLVDNLSAGYDKKANHKAIERFIRYANALRTRGFRNQGVNFTYRAISKVFKTVTGRYISAETACRWLPFFEFSLIGNGEVYGLAHYDKSISDFLYKVIGATDTQGIIAAEGLIKPFYSPSTLNRSELLDLSRNFLVALNAEALRQADAARWCDDTPQNAQYAEFLQEMYPSGKIIHMVRDPRDVAASYMEQIWVSNDLEFTLDDLRRQYVEIMKVENSLTGKFFRTVRLEDFTLSFDSQSKKLSCFLEIDPDGFDGSVSFEASSLGRWRKKFSTRQREMVEDFLHEACDYYGYL